MNKKFLLPMLIILLVVMLLIAPACDENDETESTPTPTVTSESTDSILDADVVPPLAKKGRLRVATTTSLYDTGLWGYLEEIFEDRYDVEVDVLYAGTGKALDLGMNGDVDVVTVHSRSREEAFVTEGYGVERVVFAYNYFLIVGPEDDPAGIKDMSPEDAFNTLFETEAGTFISRGDDSGTHGKEKSIWAAAGYDYEDVRNAGDWYVEGGAGMGPTLVHADERGGYTLTDMGTFLTYKGDLNLVPIVDEGDMLFNPYSALVCTETKQLEMAQAMVDFLTSDEIQSLIDKYGVAEYGLNLFNPCAGPTGPCAD